MQGVASPDILADKLSVTKCNDCLPTDGCFVQCSPSLSVVHLGLLFSVYWNGKMLPALARKKTGKGKGCNTSLSSICEMISLPVRAKRGIGLYMIRRQTYGYLPDP